MSMTSADFTLGGGKSQTGGVIIPSAQVTHLSALSTQVLHASAHWGHYTSLVS